MKQGQVLSSLLLNFALEFSKSTVQEKREELESYQTHWLLVYAAGVSVLDVNISAIKKYTESSREVGIEVNTEKTKHMVIYRH
jgi:hypothetical protein